ncbi:cobalt/nickel transport system ATP-binding protein [Balnearium lithotrophicum]|uniref:Cobalt/nickel transport system ATP-binding protein n=1 Tax=Balnearium lithotrophicum TaxID=223788 RepID=A0A521D427_9BACT|nr:ABC transporter ATP-binding protein [Balnearium lithotrophicum]SMO66424.1 cobalt/nickel transport system ATP-binding protein [Balnearium lithotrophicum]
MEILSTRNLKVSLDNREVLRGVNFSIREGEKVFITGPNGAGKTTFLETLMGFVEIEEGVVFYRGKELKKEKDFKILRGKVGYVFQNPDDQLFAPTVEEELAFAPLIKGLKRERVKEIVERTLKLFSIENLRDKPTYKLSGGEKRIVSVACVLTMEPELILLDEPTAGLDSERWKLLKKFFESTEVSLLVVTHDRELLDSLNWPVFKMENGALSQVR